MENKKITVYFSDYCGHCANLKAWLTKKGVPFKAINTENPEVTKELKKRGVTAVPFTIIEDELTGEKDEIIGFNQKKFENICF
ncbi:MAG TPA: glutaredoxin family protein [Bacillus bacterium]|nr:glutaredoxin family protein [Bacillus sp. (in: firmicutes)]